MSETPIEQKSTDKTVQNNTVTETTPSKYAVLMETSGEECESWLYFIRYEGNKENLENLQTQIESVNWYILDDLSTFDLELDYLVSETTAKEMTKIDLNSYSFNRKFDGKLKRIELNLRKKDKNEKKMIKVFDVLGYGQIEDYIDNEDLDPEDLTSTNESSEEENESENESSDSDQKNIKTLPSSLLNNNLQKFNNKHRRHKRK